MHLEFVSVEEFYFALTLTVKTLEEFNSRSLVEQTRSRLQDKFGQPSTVAPGKQNTFNYVFRVYNQLNNQPDSKAHQHIVSISDWQDKLRLSSNYGWMLDAERKPVRSEQFDQRPEFAQNLRSHLKQWLELDLPAENGG